jgi:hypothetical protein
VREMLQQVGAVVRTPSIPCEYSEYPWEYSEYRCSTRSIPCEYPPCSSASCARCCSSWVQP